MKTSSGFLFLGDIVDCIVLDIKGKAMIRYKGQNYCLHSTYEQAKFDIEQNYPHSMKKDFEIIDWVNISNG